MTAKYNFSEGFAKCFLPNVYIPVSFLTMHGIHSVGIATKQNSLGKMSFSSAYIQQIMCDSSIIIAYKHATNLRIWIRNIKRADKFGKRVFYALHIWINQPIIQFQIIELGLLPLTKYSSSFLTFSSSFPLNKLVYSEFVCYKK